MNTENFLDKIFFNVDGNIEVREIDRDNTKKAKRYFFSSLEQLKKYTPPVEKHVYFGVYTRRGRGGTAIDCSTTGALWADYDYKTKDEVKSIIKEKGLPLASILVKSGYGIHAYWVLNERIGNEAANVLRAIASRTGADTKAAEKARILRLPGSFNLKKSPVLCEILEINENKYTIEQFKELLKTELNYIEKVKSITGEKEDIKEFKNCSRTCIKIMAKGATEGHRNFALCKLTKWLQLKGYNRREALDVITRWNTLNIPPKPNSQVITEFNKVWTTDYKLLGCKFKNNKDLQEQSDYFCSMGECKHATLQEVEIIESDSSSKIDNVIFQDNIYPEIRGLELAIYFSIAKKEGITRDHLCEVVGTHRKDKIFINSVDHLANLGLIKVIEGNKRIKEKDILTLGSLYNEGRGYTIINNLLSECFLGKRISDTEYKLLILLKSYSYTESSIYPKVTTLASKMGKTDRTIRSTLRSLEHKLYIKSNHIRKENGSTKLYIKLLF